MLGWSTVRVLTGANNIIAPDNGDHDDGSQPLIWASNGGGWRAMALNIGYANIFMQADLISDSYRCYVSLGWVPVLGTIFLLGTLPGTNSR